MPEPGPGLGIVHSWDERLAPWPPAPRPLVACVGKVTDLALVLVLALDLALVPAAPRPLLVACVGRATTAW